MAFPPDIFMQFDSVSMLVAGKTCTKHQKLEQPCTPLIILQMRFAYEPEIFLRISASKSAIAASAASVVDKTSSFFI